MKRATCAGILLVLLAVRAHSARETPGHRLLSITLVPAAGVVRAGNSRPLVALGHLEDGVNGMTVGADLSRSVGWSSARPGVATVGDGVVTAIAPGMTTIQATDRASGIASDAGAGALTVVGKLARIQLRPARRALPVRESTSYHAIGTFEHDLTLEITSDVDWRIADPHVAWISPVGRARGLALGSTLVSALDRRTGISSTTSSGDGALTVVEDLTSLRISPSTIALARGGMARLKARAAFKGTPQVFTHNARVHWSSSDSTVVAVEKEGGVRCTGEGSAVISAEDRATSFTSTASGGDARVICGGDVLAIRVSPRRYVLPVGTTRQMRATYVFADGTVAEGTPQVTWSSSASNLVAVVTEGPKAGTVTALAPGRSTIVAFDAARNLSSDHPDGRNGVLIVPRGLQSLTILSEPAREPLSGAPGSVLKLVAHAIFDRGLARNVNGLVAWSSSDPACLTVSAGDAFNPPGTARLLKPGTVIVSATYPRTGAPDPRTATIQIRVVAASSPSGALLPSAP